ncbi:hypothetical protein LTR37_018031 [Vermiconidia calcicola]|uniref:Uncharacterized protein n=1 Tax=Vermiconidia calcicola TaxID=1690605 RepID=A0ACC3MI47_9PEZI|nr:hypothetical protein LTR37_018031 [Vermiconidia calcicola]
MLLSRLSLLNRLNHSRPFTAVSRLLEKPLPRRRVIDENEITESFLKGSGPGGLVVKCQETRSREQNRKLARRLLSERLEEREKGSESRTAIKTERARTKKASADKKARRKYKKLAEEKAADPDGPEEGLARDVAIAVNIEEGKQVDASNDGDQNDKQ